MLNMFGGNMHEVGSLSENLVLNTAGKVKIRFGSKFIDLLDNKGNINVKLPKIISKVKSLLILAIFNIIYFNSDIIRRKYKKCHKV